MSVEVGIEDRVRSRAKRGALKTAILRTIAFGGLVTLAIAAPKVTKALPHSLIHIVFDRPKSARNAAVGRLIREGFLSRELSCGMRVLRITQKGEKYLAHVQARSIIPPRRWDGKWRIVIFDIREKRRATRDRLRRGILSAGFIRLQDSVWVHPYPCEEFIALLKADVHIGKDVLYIIAEEIENELSLREHFGLN